jgi:hypothetical protein
MAPNPFNVADALVGAAPKPPIVWVRGDRDVIVSDTSLFDRAYLGLIGGMPDWPGADACPPQPMVGQTRAVLQRYAGSGGSYREIVADNCGDSPHIERPVEFAAELLKLVNVAAGRPRPPTERFFLGRSGSRRGEARGWPARSRSCGTAAAQFGQDLPRL